MHRTLTTVAASILVLTSAAAEAGQVRFGMGGIFQLPVVSYRERPFQTVVQQQFDYSCGSAALATLLTFHYQRPSSETEIFEAMYEAGDQAQIQAVGFSLLDMKAHLQRLGYRADGFRISIEKLATVGVPAIALIELDGYRHFVVIKGIEAGGVLVGDPARGVGFYTVDHFEALRVDDIVFVIRDQAKIAKANFNKTRDWRLQRAIAPLGQALDRQALAEHGALARIPVQFRYPVANPQVR
jgi:predicted double-glycine peptidase